VGNNQWLSMSNWPWDRRLRATGGNPGCPLREVRRSLPDELARRGNGHGRGQPQRIMPVAGNNADPPQNPRRSIPGGRVEPSAGTASRDREDGRMTWR
jgi:hypothetical protein